MTPDLTRRDVSPARLSHVIAEALVERYGPSQIERQADHLGLPRPLTRVIQAACCATATDRTMARPARFVTGR
jgi:hypothetical protein